MQSPQEEGPEIDHTATIPAGRIVHDERGNALWKWRGDTDSSDDEPSGVLKHVDLSDLTVEGGKRGGGAADGGGGYDPYNQVKPRSK